MDTSAPPVNGSAVLAALLERSGIEYRRQCERFRFVFAQNNRKWQTVCDCRAGLVLVYGIYPSGICDTSSALTVCNELNRQVVRGGFFVQDRHFIFRTGADLFELCDASETVARALEYNASAISGFWPELSAATAEDTLFVPRTASL